jgi:hypothetical protein
MPAFLLRDGRHRAELRFTRIGHTVMMVFIPRLVGRRKGFERNSGEF